MYKPVKWSHYTFDGPSNVCTVLYQDHTDLSEGEGNEANGYHSPIMTHAVDNFNCPNPGQNGIFYDYWASVQCTNLDIDLTKPWKVFFDFKYEQQAGRSFGSYWTYLFSFGTVDSNCSAGHTTAQMQQAGSTTSVVRIIPTRIIRTAETNTASCCNFIYDSSTATANVSTIRWHSYAMMGGYNYDNATKTQRYVSLFVDGVPVNRNTSWTTIAAASGLADPSQPGGFYMGETASTCALHWSYRNLSIIGYRVGSDKEEILVYSPKNLINEATAPPDNPSASVATLTCSKTVSDGSTSFYYNKNAATTFVQNPYTHSYGIQCLENELRCADILPTVFDSSWIIECWTYASSSYTTNAKRIPCFFALTASNGILFSLYLNSSKQYQCTSIVCNKTNLLDTWTHHIIKYSSINNKYYWWVNGEYVSSGTRTVSSSNYPTLLSFGHRPYATNGITETDVRAAFTGASSTFKAGTWSHQVQISNFSLRQGLALETIPSETLVSNYTVAKSFLSLNRPRSIFETYVDKHKKYQYHSTGESTNISIADTTPDNASTTLVTNTDKYLYIPGKFSPRATSYRKLLQSASSSIKAYSWTISFWFTLHHVPHITTTSAGATNVLLIPFSANSNTQLYFNVATNTGNYWLSLKTSTETAVNSANTHTSYVENLVDKWHHIAICREGSNTNTKIYLDGQLDMAGYNLTMSTSTQLRKINDDPIVKGMSNTTKYRIYIDDLYVSGKCLWSKNFTPPDHPLCTPYAHFSELRKKQSLDEFLSYEENNALFLNKQVFNLSFDRFGIDDNINNHAWIYPSQNYYRVTNGGILKVSSLYGIDQDKLTCHAGFSFDFRVADTSAVNNNKMAKCIAYIGHGNMFDHSSNAMYWSDINKTATFYGIQCNNFNIVGASPNGTSGIVFGTGTSLYNSMTYTNSNWWHRVTVVPYCSNTAGNVLSWASFVDGVYTSKVDVLTLNANINSTTMTNKITPDYYEPPEDDWLDEAGKGSWYQENISVTDLLIGIDTRYYNKQSANTFSACQLFPYEVQNICSVQYFDDTPPSTWGAGADNNTFSLTALGGYNSNYYYNVNYISRYENFSSNDLAFSLGSAYRTKFSEETTDDPDVEQFETSVPDITEALYHNDQLNTWGLNFSNTNNNYTLQSAFGIISILDQDFTIEGYLQIDAPESGTLWCIRSGVYQAIKLEAYKLRTGDNINFRLNAYTSSSNANSNSIIAYDSISLGEVVHFAVAYSAIEHIISLFINGNCIGSLNFTMWTTPSLFHFSDPLGNGSTAYDHAWGTGDSRGPNGWILYNIRMIMAHKYNPNDNFSPNLREYTQNPTSIVITQPYYNTKNDVLEDVQTCNVWNNNGAVWDIDLEENHTILNLTESKACPTIDWNESIDAPNMRLWQYWKEIYWQTSFMWTLDGKEVQGPQMLFRWNRTDYLIYNLDNISALTLHVGSESKGLLVSNTTIIAANKYYHIFVAHSNTSVCQLGVRAFSNINDRTSIIGSSASHTVSTVTLTSAFSFKPDKYYQLGSMQSDSNEYELIQKIKQGQIYSALQYTYNNGTLTDWAGNTWKATTVGGKVLSDGFNRYAINTYTTSTSTSPTLTLTNTTLSDPYLRSNEDWTVSFWIKFKDGSSYESQEILYLSNLFCIRARDYRYPNYPLDIELNSASYYADKVAKINAPYVKNGYTYPSDTEWYHIALVSKNNTTYLYVQGIKCGYRDFNSTSPIEVLLTNNLKISQANTLNCQRISMIEDFFIVKGVALWEDDFTPPTIPLCWIAQGFTGNKGLLIDFSSSRVVNTGSYGASAKFITETNHYGSVQERKPSELYMTKQGTVDLIQFNSAHPYSLQFISTAAFSEDNIVSFVRNTIFDLNDTTIITAPTRNTNPTKWNKHCLNLNNSTGLRIISDEILDWDGYYTLALWFYIPNNSATYQPLIYINDSTKNNGNVLLGIYSKLSNTARLGIIGSNQEIVSNSGQYSYNTWNHLAIVNNKTNLTVYLNGTSVYTYTLTDNCSILLRDIILGYNPNNATVAKQAGYIDDLLITRTALYTKNFTVPQEAATFIDKNSVVFNIHGIYIL